MIRKWLTAEWLAVLAASVVLVYTLFVRPLVGIADNGDFQRIMWSVGVTYGVEGESYDDRFFGYFHHLYAYRSLALGGYVSTQLLTAFMAVWTGKLLPGHFFDIRVMALLYSILFLTAVYGIVKRSKGTAKAANAVLVALVVFVFADTGYTAYYSSFYGEPVTYLFLLLMIVFGLKLARADVPKRSDAIWFFVSAIMLVGSKTQYAPVGIVIVLLAVRIWRLRQDRLWRRTITAWTAGLIGVTALFYLISPRQLDKINVYQAVFYGILKDSPTPEQDLLDLGIDPALAVNAGSDFFTSNVVIPQQDPRLEEAFYKKVSFGGVIKFYLTHPVRFWSKLEAAADNGWTIRPYYLGNYEKSENKPRGAVSHAFDRWSDWKNQHHPDGFLWIVGIYVLYGAGLLMAYRRASSHADRLIPDLFTAVAAIGAISFVVPFVGSGEADFAKHLFLFTVCLDIMLVSGIWYVIRRLVGGRSAI